MGGKDSDPEGVEHPIGMPPPQGPLQRLQMSKPLSSSSPSLRTQDQQLLLPPAALQEWLPPEHLAYLISEQRTEVWWTSCVVCPDLILSCQPSPVRDRYHWQETRPAWRPSLPSQDDGQGAALRLLHWGGLIAAHRPASPRGHRVSGAGGQPPDFRTVSDFRKDHLEALAEQVGQVLELCRRAGLVKLATWPWTAPRSRRTPPSTRR